MPDVRHVVLVCLLWCPTPLSDQPQGGVREQGDVEQARAVIRPLLDAVYANAEAFSSFYIRAERRPTRVRSEDAEGKEAGEFLDVFEWWRNGDVCHLRITHRSDSPPGEHKVEKRVLEDGSEIVTGIGHGGRFTTTTDYIGLRGADLLLFGSSTRPGLERDFFAPDQGDLFYGPQDWDVLAPFAFVPFVLVPDGLSSRSAVRAVEQALQTGDFRWNDGISLLGHRCVLVQVHSVRDVTQSNDIDPGAEPIRYRLYRTERVYFDACCPGAIRGLDEITRTEDADGSQVVTEIIDRFPVVRRLKDRVWIHWKKVSDGRVYRLSEPEREDKFSSITEVQRCEFGPLREDEGAIEVRAGTRIYEAPDYDRVYVVPEDTVLTLANFESWVKKVRERLLPAEIALRTPVASVGRLAPASDRQFVSPLFVALVFLLIPPLAFVLIRLVRRIRNRWRESPSDGSAL